MIEYSIEVYLEAAVEGKDPIRLSHRKEIDVREYLFTDEEIQEDWHKYQNILDLKKVLRPNTIFTARGDHQHKAASS